MTWFWPNFKGRILGPCLKDADCYGDICQGNIYVLVTFIHIYNISAFYWSNFDQTFWTQFFLDHDFCRPKCSWAKLLRTHIFLMQIFFSSPKMLGLTVFIPEILLDPKKKSNSIFFLPQIFSDLKFFQTQNIFGPKIFLDFFFQMKFFLPTIFFKKFSSPKIFVSPNFFFEKFVWTQNFFFRPKIFYRSKFLDHKSYKISIKSSVS